MEAQQRGLTVTLKQYLSPTGGDSEAEQTPPPQLQWTPRPRKAANGRPSAEEKKAWRQQMRKQREGLMLWWLDRMVRADDQLRERMTWFWHGHFATSFRKVRVASLMLAQNQTLRQLGLGDFQPLAQAMIIDPAMLVWLDGNDNTAKAPNENLSREFMELFALGEGPYTESDVKQAARALTGWKVNRLNGFARLRPRLYDTGSKHILGHDGDFDASSFVQLVLSQPSCASFVISRVWFRLVSSTPPEAAAMARLRGRTSTASRHCWRRWSPNRRFATRKVHWSSSRWSGRSASCVPSAYDPVSCRTSRPATFWGTCAAWARSRFCHRA